ncbi:MAG: ParB N-terminal domain-containing protein [Anaerolineales bacterium]|jgi:hypothetical protein
MPPFLPTLKILPVAQLLPHEQHDQQRVLPLIKSLDSDGFLRNPPVVTPLSDDQARYVVLDGANRTAAFQMIGCPHIVVQVVESVNPGLRLRAWNHVVWGLESRALLDGLSAIAGLNLREIDPGKDDPELSFSDCMARVLLSEKRGYDLCTELGDLARRGSLLNAIVDSYKQRAMMDRTTVDTAESLTNLYDRFSGLIVYPIFKLDEILKLASEGLRIPAGITRFMISPRALRLNYPLADLKKGQSLSEKNAALAQWLQERLARRGVRHYQEETVLFDE